MGPNRDRAKKAYKRCSPRTIHDRYKNYTEKFTAIFISQMRPSIYRTCGTRRSGAENASLTSFAIKPPTHNGANTRCIIIIQCSHGEFFSRSEFPAKKPHKSVKYYGAIQVNISALLRRGVFREPILFAWAMFFKMFRHIGNLKLWRCRFLIFQRRYWKVSVFFYWAAVLVPMCRLIGTYVSVNV